MLKGPLLETTLADYLLFDKTITMFVFGREVDMYMSSVSGVPGGRAVVQRLRGVPATDAAGVRINRIIGTLAFPDVDPFLLFDEVHMDAAGAGAFPETPHRGFESLAYVLEGQLSHSDTLGNAGEVKSGGAQWLNMARGVIHAEHTATDAQSGRGHGFRLWINLPAREKGLEPQWRAIAPEDIPAVIFGDAEVRVLAGRYHGLMGPVAPPTTQPFIADVSLKPDAEVTLPIPPGYQGFVYAFEQAVAVGETLVNRGQAGILGDEGDRVTLTAGQKGARALLITGMPLGEPVVRHGPFVMNTLDEVKQAFTDFQNGQFGQNGKFER
jgi:redox-sensitive bicupin YhaK (pirin superfamily)